MKLSVEIVEYNLEEVKAALEKIREAQKVRPFLLQFIRDNKGRLDEVGQQRLAEGVLGPDLAHQNRLIKVVAELLDGKNNVSTRIRVRKVKDETTNQ